jgi:hypothetical protein
MRWAISLTDSLGCAAGAIRPAIADGILSPAPKTISKCAVRFNFSENFDFTHAASAAWLDYG